MVGLAHVALNVSLCPAVTRLPAGTPVAMTVVAAYRVGGNEFEKTVRFQRGDDPQAHVEFDVHRGVYHLLVAIPKYGCTASDYVAFLPDQVRALSETLQNAPAPAVSVPATLMFGTAPQSFVYAKPTLSFFDKGLACDQPVTSALAPQPKADYDEQSYYLSYFADPSLAAHEPFVAALRLRTPTGLAHYVRLPIAFPDRPVAWPGSVQFNVTEDMLDELATQKTDTLLCLKLWETSAH